jgi:hypothetical protein
MVQVVSVLKLRGAVWNHLTCRLQCRDFHFGMRRTNGIYSHPPAPFNGDYLTGYLLGGSALFIPGSPFLNQLKSASGMLPAIVPGTLSR